jgi:hypothetical protein
MLTREILEPFFEQCTEEEKSCTYFQQDKAPEGNG